MGSCGPIAVRTPPRVSAWSSELFLFGSALCRSARGGAPAPRKGSPGPPSLGPLLCWLARRVASVGPRSCLVGVSRLLFLCFFFLSRFLVRLSSSEGRLLPSFLPPYPGGANASSRPCPGGWNRWAWSSFGPPAAGPPRAPALAAPPSSPGGTGFMLDLYGVWDTVGSGLVALCISAN